MMSWPASPRIRIRPIGPGSPMRADGSPRTSLAGGASDRSGRCPSRVCTTRSPMLRAASRALAGGIAAARSETSLLPRLSPKPPGSRKSRCMSMITSAVAAGSKESGVGSAARRRVVGTAPGGFRSLGPPRPAAGMARANGAKHRAEAAGGRPRSVGARKRSSPWRLPGIMAAKCAERAPMRRRPRRRGAVRLCSVAALARTARASRVHMPRIPAERGLGSRICCAWATEFPAVARAGCSGISVAAVRPVLSTGGTRRCPCGGSRRQYCR